MKIILKSTEETAKFAKNFVAGLKPSQTSATVVGLYGDLGAGKTNFVQSCAKILGVAEAVQSPTFVIMKHYVLSPSDLLNVNSYKFLIHIDAYRLNSSEELLNLGWTELINDPKNLILVEWVDKVEDVLPKNSIKMYFSHISESERKISF